MLANHPTQHQDKPGFVPVEHLPTELVQQIAVLLPLKDQVHWVLTSRHFASVLVDRLLPNAVARGQISRTFVWACHCGRLGIVERCLELGVPADTTVYDVHYKDTICIDGLRETSAIAAALAEGHIHVVEKLVAHGANVNDFLRQALRLDALHPYVKRESTMRYLLDNSNLASTGKYDYRRLRISRLIDANSELGCIMLAVENNLSCISSLLVFLALDNSRTDVLRALLRSRPDKLLQPRCEHTGGSRKNAFLHCHVSWVFRVRDGNGKAAIAMLEELERSVPNLREELAAPNPCTRHYSIPSMVQPVVGPGVQPRVLRWILSHGFQDLRAGTWRREEFFEHVKELRSLAKFTRPIIDVLVEHDPTLAVLRPLRSRAGVRGKLSHHEFLDLLEGFLDDDSLSTAEILRPDFVIPKLLRTKSYWAITGPLRRTAGVIERLAEVQHRELQRPDQTSVQKFRQVKIHNAALHLACRILLAPLRKSLERTKRKGGPPGSRRNRQGPGPYSEDDDVTLAEWKLNIFRVIRALLKGSNIFAKDASKKTAIRYAKESGAYSSLVRDFDAARHEHAERAARNGWGRRRARKYGGLMFSELWALKMKACLARKRREGRLEERRREPALS